ncbi:MAG: NAD(P)/FAD-dependent oxidoreductase [Syntrophorhabdaceae bacterium]|nr:NAD(P)/FAD-dependent oxidoreductase [Syntrophorhabdaceae bacterium]
MDIYDVIVVGAGPAGLYASRLLAEKGYSVILLDAKEEVGKNVICTGIVGRDIFQRFDIPDKSLIRFIQNIKVLSSGGKTITYNHPFPFACVVDREGFDKSLFESAIKKGVVGKFSFKVIDVKVERDGVRVFGAGSSLKGKTLLIATGVEYDLNKRVGLGYPIRFVNAAQAYVPYEGIEDVTIVIGNNIAKKGFGWIVPLEGCTAKVGVITEGRPKEYFLKVIELCLQHDPVVVPMIKPIAQGIVSKTFCERVLVVGEAAGQVKTTTGGGVFFGLLCAEIAARVLIGCLNDNDFSEERMSVYEKEWKSLIGREISLGIKVRDLCGRLSDRQIEKIFNAINMDGFLDFIEKNANFDWHGKFIIAILNRLLNFIK